MPGAWVQFCPCSIEQKWKVVWPRYSAMTWGLGIKWRQLRGGYTIRQDTFIKITPYMCVFVCAHACAHAVLADFLCCLFPPSNTHVHTHISVCFTAASRMSAWDLPRMHRGSLASCFHHLSQEQANNCEKSHISWFHQWCTSPRLRHWSVASEHDLPGNNCHLSLSTRDTTMFHFSVTLSATAIWMIIFYSFNKISTPVTHFLDHKKKDSSKERYLKLPFIVCKTGLLWRSNVLVFKSLSPLKAIPSLSLPLMQPGVLTYFSELESKERS